MNRYFDLLEEVLTKNDLIGRPFQLFNMDESGMPLSPKPVKSVFRKGDPNPVAISSGDKTQITVVACVSASGSCMPPMVILDRKTLPPRFTEGEVPGTTYGLSKNGWIDQELFDGWFTNHFLKHAPLARPLLLLLDGHSSHHCPDAVRLAIKEKVILFALPPNTTHISQPMDKGCFGPLTTCWKEECHNYMSMHPGVVINRHIFSQLFSKAWMNAMSMKNIMGGFKICGIFPFNRDALRLPLQQQSESVDQLAKESGLAYVPLFTPSKVRNIRNEYDRGEYSSSRCSTYSSSSVNHCNFSSQSSLSYSSFRRSRSSSPCHHSCCSRRGRSYASRIHHKRYHSSSRPSRRSFSAPGKHSSRVQPHCGSLTTLLAPPIRTDMPLRKSCGRVLTSIENVRAINEKERMKKEKLRQKEERKLRIERKKMERAQMAAKKKSGKKAVGRNTCNKKGLQEQTFTAEEIKLFKRRQENGYDITTDERYNVWLKALDVQSNAASVLSQDCDEYSSSESGE